MSEKLIKPALKGSWVLFFGSVLGPIIIFSGRSRGESIWPWLALTFFCVVFFLHRCSLRYTLSPTQLTMTAWWGLGHPEIITTSTVDRVEIIRSFAARLANCAHIYVHSALASEGSITILAQSQPDRLVSEIEKLSKYLKNKVETISDDDLDDGLDDGL